MVLTVREGLYIFYKMELGLNKDKKKRVEGLNEVELFSNYLYVSSNSNTLRVNSAF